MNVLSIGNSFSQNAHLLLPRMIKADGDSDFMLCNLFIPGCSLEEHWKNMKSEEEKYQYQVYLPGETKMTTADEIALYEPLEDEEWDYVTIQQASGLSGISESWSPYAEELTAFIRMCAPKAKVLIHETWAYDESTKHPDFAKYSSSTGTMFDCISEAVAVAEINTDIDGVIPSGLAFQIARQTSFKKSLTAEDGFHASVFGSYLAGACFYEKITGRSILDNRYVIEDCPKEYTELLALCAHTAVEKYGK